LGARHAAPPIEPIEVEYRLHWSLDSLAPPAGFVRSTRHGKAAYYDPGLERFMVDFDGAQLQALNAGTAIEHRVAVGQVRRSITRRCRKIRSTARGGWRSPSRRMEVDAPSSCAVTCAWATIR
jgi:glucan biosynthesis protein